MDPQRLIPGDSTLIENIVNYLKAKGIFDEFRHECLADVDTKSSCQNLSQRVDGYTSKFLANEAWHPDLNKNELRNKLRRNLDESGMLAVGADHVVEQVINPKIHQLFLPKIIEVVHQYIKEQNELLNKKPESTSSDNTSSSEKSTYDISDNKVKTSVSDPIADILSFSYSKSKPTPSTSTHVKAESIQQKHVDTSKIEKKKEEKHVPVVEKNAYETATENIITSTVTEIKTQPEKEKEKVKKEELEISQEVSKKVIKEEVKPEKKKTEEVKAQSSDTVIAVEESKTNVSIVNKSPLSGKKDIDKNKQKLKSSNTQKSSSSSSEVKKSKKESSDKSLEKPPKSKPIKSLKESSSPTKSDSSVKKILKEEKNGESSKSRTSDSSTGKTSEPSLKKLSKSSSIKKEGSTKQKAQSDKSKISKSSDKPDQNILSDSTSEKIDKSKVPKSSDKNDQNIQYDSSSEKTDKSKISKSTDKSDQNIHYDSSNSEKVTKSAYYSSSYDSSQGSDQEKSSSSSSKKERQKHFYKHAKKEKEHSDKKNKTLTDKKRPSDSDESPSKMSKSDKTSKLEKSKDTTTVEAAKVNSRSNSFGSTSSLSSSSNASKDNLAPNSDEVSESSFKDKKKKQVKEKDTCQNPTKVLPPPPPPPPSSSSLLCDLPSSSAEMSSMEDSAASESSSSESMSEESSSDSELESKDLVFSTLNENTLSSSTDNINDFYDIFLYSSSSSEFEGFENSPEKKKKENLAEVVYDSDISVSSVHTSDLSSYDDELSDDDFSLISESHLASRKRLTLKEARELIQNKAALLARSKNSSAEKKPDSTADLFNDGPMQMSSTHISSDEESSPSEPKRSLRRERKLNPRYASSEYTSIFNSRKETFITKQSSPSIKNNSHNSSPNSEKKFGRKDLLQEKGKLLKKSSLESKINAAHQDEIEQLQKTKVNMHNLESCEEKELSDMSGMSSADEMDSIMNKEIFQENDETADNNDNNHLKIHLKLKPQNNSKLNMNSYSLKRKLPVTESTPVKRPCSRSSVDSSSSEIVPNENKPFNSEKQNIVEDKILRDGNMKDLTDGIKRDPFCKQRTNNNGDILGQKDIFPKNSHGKTINITEKKTNESDASKELNAL